MQGQYYGYLYGILYLIFNTKGLKFMSFNTQVIKNKTVEIVDSCMGSSKSTNALKYMDDYP